MWNTAACQDYFVFQFSVGSHISEDKLCFDNEGYLRDFLGLWSIIRDEIVCTMFLVIHINCFYLIYDLYSDTVDAVAEYS